MIFQRYRPFLRHWDVNPLRTSPIALLLLLLLLSRSAASRSCETGVMRRLSSTRKSDLLYMKKKMKKLIAKLLTRSVCRAFDQCVAPAASALLCDSTDQECICSGYRINRGSVPLPTPLLLLFILFPCILFAPQTRIPLANAIHTKLDVIPSTAPPKPGNLKTEVPNADLYPPARPNFLPLVLRHILPPSRVMLVNRQQQQHHR